MDIPRGRIRAEWWISCGICSTSEFVDTMFMPAPKQAKDNGWKHTKRDGWICPDCQKAQDAANDDGAR